MNAIVKFIIGILILLLGIYWYVPNAVPYLPATLESLAVVFSGVFGLILILLGAIIAWIEYEDIKWEKEEKEEKAKVKEI